MSDFKSLMQQPSEKDIKDCQRSFKESLKNAKAPWHNTPELQKMGMECHYFNMAYNAVRQRNEALLDEMYEGHEKLNPGDERFLHHIQFNRACLRISQHRFEEAIGMLEALEQSDINIHRSHILHLLVDVWEYLEDYNEAARYVHKFFAYWLIDNRGNSYTYYGGFPYMLEILARAGETDKVIEYGMERIAKKFRNDTYIYFLVAYMYQLKDDLENALKYYRYIFKKKHPYPEAFVNVGEYYGRKLNDLDKNIDYYIRAVKVAGGDVDYRRLLSGIYYDLGLMFTKLEDEERANAYRVKLFEAMASPILSDLVLLFNNDAASAGLYRDWLSGKQAGRDASSWN